MTNQIKVPALPESVQDAVVATWHKKPGDPIKRDENIVDLETDKVMLEVPSPIDGFLQEITKKEGDVVTADEVLGLMSAEASAAPNEDAKSAPAPSEVKTEVTSEIKSEVSSTTSTATNTQPAAKVDENLSPSARRAAKLGGGEQDLESLAANIAKSAPPPQPAVQSQSPAPSPAPASATPLVKDPAGRVEKRVPMSRLRQKIAERLVQAQHTTAMLTTFNEVNLKNIMDLRAKYKDLFAKKYDTKLGFMSFFVKASVEALKNFPQVNASIDGNDFVFHGFYDIGIAVGSDRGLVVPILRDVDNLSMADIEKNIKDFGIRAQQGKLSLDEMTGGTFTISNGGTYGSMMSTPILNPPQSAILGMHNIIQRPIVENNQVVIRPMMYLALSYDHRIIDGKEAVLFLRTIKELLEEPSRFLLEI